MQSTWLLTFLLAVSSVFLWKEYPSCLGISVVVAAHSWCVGRNPNPYFRLKRNSNPPPNPTMGFLLFEAKK
jgi:hypothetical protein